MSKIVSIGTAVPAYCHRQDEVLSFMQRVYACSATESRKLRYLYARSGIQTRYSVVPDYSWSPNDWKFYPRSENLEPFPSLELRMSWYQRYAAPLSMEAIRNALDGCLKTSEITHLITVSCTGMSAPGLDLELLGLLDLPRNTFRTSVNFMGCYAAVHALKLADAICTAQPESRVLIVCTELCTLHFQREHTMDNLASSLLFADGSAAVLVTGNSFRRTGLRLFGFYSEVMPRARNDMSWELSSSGFLMTLSGYIPDLIREDFDALTSRALANAGIRRSEIDAWCIHPGGIRILDTIGNACGIPREKMEQSYEVLGRYGNMSSPTLLFVLQQIWQQIRTSNANTTSTVMAAAFGPGLTMETFFAKTE